MLPGKLGQVAGPGSERLSPHLFPGSSPLGGNGKVGVQGTREMEVQSSVSGYGMVYKYPRASGGLNEFFFSMDLQILRASKNL